MRFTIRYQLFLPLLALIVGVVGASVWSAWASGQRARRQIETQIDNIAATVKSAKFDLNTKTLQLMKGMSGAEFLLAEAERKPLRDESGNLVASTLAVMPAELPAPAEHLDTPVRIGAQSYLCRGLAYERRGQILYVFYPESLMREAFWQALGPALVLGVVGAVIAILISVLLTQTIARRIEELERRTRLIAQGDFSPMPLSSRDDELRDLAGSINDMAQRLTQFQETILRTERLRLLGQVSGGLAHQLRNGVAGARLAVQLHAQDCPADGDREALDVALRQLALVEMHLKRFLDLGKTIEIAREPCQLEAILKETIELLGPQFRHANIDLRVATNPTSSLEIVGDAGQLGHLFLNLLTNALEAAGPGGWVEVQSGITSAESAFVEVRDSGPGPAPDIAERLFEPFVTGKREGVGLGLAVARQVVLAHGGTIRWSRENDCTCFRIEIPIPDRSAGGPPARQI
jgi:signal transduction histidine kinase